MIETILAVIVWKKSGARNYMVYFTGEWQPPPRILFKTDYVKYAYIFTLKLVRYSFHLLTTYSPYLILQSVWKPYIIWFWMGRVTTCPLFFIFFHIQKSGCCRNRNNHSAWRYALENAGEKRFTLQISGYYFRWISDKMIFNAKTSLTTQRVVRDVRLS